MAGHCWRFRSHFVSHEGHNHHRTIYGNCGCIIWEIFLQHMKSVRVRDGKCLLRPFLSVPQERHKREPKDCSDGDGNSGPLVIVHILLSNAFCFYLLGV